MTKRNCNLTWQLLTIALVGILAARIDPWARENPSAYFESGRWIMLVIFFFAAIGRGASGRLKSGPDRLRSSDVAERNSAVPVLMAGYLFILGIGAVTSYFVGFRLDDHLASPLVSFFVFLPFVLIGVWGRYKVSLKV